MLQYQPGDDIHREDLHSVSRNEIFFNIDFLKYCASRGRGGHKLIKWTPHKHHKWRQRTQYEYEEAEGVEQRTEGGRRGTF